MCIRDRYNIDKDLNMALEISRGDNVTVAVIDTGIDVNHPYLSEHITEGWNFVNDVNDCLLYTSRCVQETGVAYRIYAV